MKLLIDEMYPPILARQVRRRGHDVIGVTERKELRSLNDAALFEVAQEERRAIVTENVADFIRLADSADQRGRLHHGLLLIDPGKYPRGNRRTIGRIVTQLDAVLRTFRDDKPRALRHWL